VVEVRGRSVHPGSAKDIMVNASLVAMEFARLLPPWERPEHTEGREGFYHLADMRGQEDRASLTYIIRDHDRERFERRKARFRAIGDYLNGAYGPGTVEVTVRDSYRNMMEMILPRMDIVRRVEDAYRALGIEPVSPPIRGGTDGATLTYKGLLCPNIATGGMNFHGRYECVAVEDMETMVEVILGIVGDEELGMRN